MKLDRELDKFTRGPWTWQRGEKWHRLHGKGDDGKPATVLRAAMNNGQVMTPMNMADQHLIAAATKMYYALKAVALTFAKAQGVMNPEEFSVIEEVQGALRAANGMES